MPPQMAFLRVTWLPRDHTSTAAELEWAGDQTRLAPGDLIDPRIPPGGSPGYTVLNIRASRRIKENLLVKGGVENLLNEKYKTHGSGVWEAGINFYASLEHTF
jgi:outer membrane receptor protein involved in Fe transport